MDLVSSGSCWRIRDGRKTKYRFVGQSLNKQTCRNGATNDILTNLTQSVSDCDVIVKARHTPYVICEIESRTLRARCMYTPYLALHGRIVKQYLRKID